MKKKCLFWPLMAATVMFCASCNNETIPEIEKNEGKSATVKISIESSSTRASSGTETAVGNESLITGIEVYTFDKDTEAMIGHAIATGTSATVKAQAGDVIIAVVANNSQEIGLVNNLGELKGKFSAHVFSKTISTKIPEDGFVMTAIENVSLNEGVNEKTIALRRTVSKFIQPTFETSKIEDISEADAKSLFEDYDGEEITFSFTAFALANGLDKTLLFNIAYPDTEWKANRVDWGIPFPFNYLNSTFDNKNYATEGVYSGDFIEAKDNLEEQTPVYVHENFPYPDFTPQGSDVEGFNPDEVYCFIIEGVLRWNGEPLTRYWRINLVKETAGDVDDYKIYRNGLYKVNVTKIKSIGYGTPKEAEEETPVIPVNDETLINVTVIVDPWDVYVSNTEM